MNIVQISSTKKNGDMVVRGNTYTMTLYPLPRKHGDFIASGTITRGYDILMYLGQTMASICEEDIENSKALENFADAIDRICEDLLDKHSSGQREITQ